MKPECGTLDRADERGVGGVEHHVRRRRVGAGLRRAAVRGREEHGERARLVPCGIWSRGLVTRGGTEQEGRLRGQANVTTTCSLHVRSLVA